MSAGSIDKNTCGNLTHLADEEGISRFECHKLVEVEENIEEMPRQFAPPEVFYYKKGVILKKQHTNQLTSVQGVINCTKVTKGMLTSGPTISTS